MPEYKSGLLPALAVWPLQAAFSSRASVIAEKLSVPMLASDASALERAGFSFLFRIDENGMALLQGKSVIAVDFITGANHHRRLHGGGRGQSVAKAVGLKSGNIIPTVLDCTAGLARDAFVLASLGCTMQLCERSVLVHLLLQDGLVRACGSDDIQLRDIVNRMQLLSLDAREHMAALMNDKQHEDDRPDVIYLDPMFPEKRKSAAVKKDMAAFHALVGADEDADSLLPLALQTARYRVVVKRPRHAPHLDNCKPGLVLEGESTRFDIYPLRSMAIS
ncbi:MAG TPA: class I SAM-dependent methyltransferase [Pseudomonadales bacterium]|nr:class I SAM-dependent methyltransferase [Pseudomonadales bacterium]